MLMMFSSCDYTCNYNLCITCRKVYSSIGMIGVKAVYNSTPIVYLVKAQF